MSGNKRKRGGRSEREETDVPIHERPLRLQAYEADLVRDRPNLERLVESRERGGLIQWGEDVWVDRFDARLLLSPADLALDSSTVRDELGEIGWDDLPSDAEDTFFLCPREVAEYHREKRLRMMEQGRQERLRALAVADEEDEQQGAEAKWGGSDEEPDEAQRNLMTRTAVHIRSSPNAAQLEMRILANHGGDPRFAFLRGRWKRAWARIRHGEASNVGSGSVPGMGGLAGYESESENGESEEERVPAPGQDETEMERVRAERRARALEWMRKKREGA